MHAALHLHHIAGQPNAKCILQKEYGGAAILSLLLLHCSESKKIVYWGPSAYITAAQLPTGVYMVCWANYQLGSACACDLSERLT